MVIAPEHPLVARLTTPDNAEAVRAYCERAASKSDLDRTDLAKTKTGVFTGSYAVNPTTCELIPIWIADYVLATYGTGAIMAVPAHDDRDFEFAKTFGLPIRAVVDPGEDFADRAAVLAGEKVFVGKGRAINIKRFVGTQLTAVGRVVATMPTALVKAEIIECLSNLGMGRKAVNYRLRDWLFSRQRFWGEPFPILHELDAAGKPTGQIRAVPQNELPVPLPDLADFKPHGRPEPPLEKAPDDWLYVTRDGRRYKRETNTMPQWAGSCWYYLRFIDPRNDKALVDPALERAWMPVDLYIGGAEHAVLHLLYARFWHKVLFDRGHVSTAEPFMKLVNQGMILGEMEFTGYRKEEGGWLSAADVRLDAENRPVDRQTGRPAKPVRVEAAAVEKQGDSFVLTAAPSIRVDSRAYKMSKSRGNVVNPDQVVKDFGADSLRLYEMFMGPLEATKPWAMTGVNGVRGFLDRVWRMIVAERSETLELNPAVQPVEPTAEQSRVLHKTVAAVTRDIERLDFNTAIARMMEFTNFFTKADVRPRGVMEQFVLLLSPFAPHLAEELWQLLGHERTLAYEPWPAADPEWLRGRHDRSAGASERQAARQNLSARRRGRRRAGSARPRGSADRRAAGGKDGGEGDHRAGAVGEFCGEVTVPHKKIPAADFADERGFSQFGVRKPRCFNRDLSATLFASLRILSIETCRNYARISPNFYLLDPRSSSDPRSSAKSAARKFLARFYRST